VAIRAQAGDPSYNTIRVILGCGSPALYEIGAPIADFTWSTGGCGDGARTITAEARRSDDPTWTRAISTSKTYSLGPPPTQPTVTPTPVSPTSTPTPTTPISTPTTSPTGGSGLFDDFTQGIQQWANPGGGATSITPSGNGAMRLTTPSGGAVEAWRDVSGPFLSAYQDIELRINLNGATLLCGDAGTPYLDQNGWRMGSLCSYVTQGSSQWQTIRMPLTAFAGFDKNSAVNRVGFRFWAQSVITVDVDDIRFISAGAGGPTSTPTPTPSPSATSPALPTATRTPTPTNTPGTTSDSFENFQSGIASWAKIGNVSSVVSGSNIFMRLQPPANSSAEASRSTSGLLLTPYQAIQLRININGASLRDGDASALYLNQGGWKYVSLSRYVSQGSTQWQTITVPLTDFSGFNKTASFSNLGIRIWLPAAGTIDVDDITFVK
jgi:hypothetical protein